jgi:hypothetical protein
MLNLYAYYEQPDILPLYDTIHTALSYFDIDHVKTWGIKLKEQDLEPIINIIQKDPEYAYQYVIRVLDHRWPEAEPYIIKNPNAAFRYAKFVMKERWPEAEPIIKTSEQAWMHYRQYFNIEQ